MLQALDKYLDFEYTDTIRQTLADFSLEMASINRGQGKRLETARHVISCVRNRGWQAGRLPGRPGRLRPYRLMV
jgi:hypothetical protein